MTSAAALAANKRNAKKSTGPRTLAGKQRSSRNALRHGLSAVVTHSECSQEVDTLAKMFVGHNDNPALLAAARRVAMVELQLIRIREERAKVLRTYTGPNLLAELRLLDRYLDRQRRQRKYALRAFDRMQIRNRTAFSQ